MAQFRSFRFSPLEIPPGYRTPSPPARATVEPLTPFESARRKDGSQVDGASTREGALEEISALHARPLLRDFKAEMRSFEAPQASSKHDLHNTSAMDAFATIALSVNQSYQVTRDIHLPSTWIQSHQYGKNGICLEKKGQILDQLEERPWKRARSDLPAEDNSRFTTIHRAPGSVSTDYELGSQVSGAVVRQPSKPEVTQDAELLLNFMNSSGANSGHGIQQSDLKNPSAHGGPAIFGYDQPMHSGPVAAHSMEPMFQGDSRRKTNLLQPFNSSPAYQSPKISQMAVGSYGQEMKPRRSVKASKKENHTNRGWPRGKPRGPRRNWASPGQSERNGKAGLVPIAAHTQNLDIDGHDSKAAGDDGSHQHQDTNRKYAFGHGSPSAHRIRDRLLPRPEKSQRRNSIAGFTIGADNRDILGQPNAVTGSTTMRRSVSDSGVSRQTPTIGLGADESDEMSSNRCAGCSLLQSPVGLEAEGEMLSWISCDGCKGWFHAACTDMTDIQIKTVDRYSCKNCVKKCGPTTFVRKSSRAHASIDYAGLNEGLVKTSSETPEHPYIKPIKDRTLKLQPDDFPRISTDDPVLQHLEEAGIFTRPLVIPASSNLRPASSPSAIDALKANRMTDADIYTPNLAKLKKWLDSDTYAIDIPDDGADALDMVIPRDLTVRHVAELYGLEEKVEVMDVKTQGEAGPWNMKKWADYYESRRKKLIRNVISLEISCSKLGKLVKRPRMVRQMDLSHSVWPPEARAKGDFPKVQLYCLMSVADSFTDFHIDFGGSSVFYHIIRGKKTFLFIPPKPKHLKKYEQWCLSPAQNQTFLPDQTKECIRVDLSEGDTMLIPSGWIHAVWTPEDSLVIGGNFLTRIHYGMQIQVAEIEKTTRVPRKFRYPHFQRVMWLTAIKYLEIDPTPPAITEIFHQGSQFGRYEDGSPISVQTYVPEKSYPPMELDGLPDLGRYLLRTALISMGKITDGITLDTKARIARAIPRGHGEPLDVVKRFAVWIAWKRGNECIPYWAYPDYVPENMAIGAGQKLSAAALKRLDQDASETAQRRNHRQDLERQQELEKFKEEEERPSELTVGNSSAYAGPRKSACTRCRRRRIRCKHREDAGPQVTDPFDFTIGDPSVHYDFTRAPSITFPFPNSLHLHSDQVAPISLDQNTMIQMTPSSAGKHARAQACDTCRKSKRRCLHDENGQIDPIKKLAAEQRKANSAKRPRKSVDGDGSAAKNLEGTPDRMTIAESVTEAEGDALAVQRQLEHSLMQASPFLDVVSSQDRTRDSEGMPFDSRQNSQTPKSLTHGNHSTRHTGAAPVINVASSEPISDRLFSRPTSSLGEIEAEQSTPILRGSAEDNIQATHLSPITPPASLDAATDIVMRDEGQGPVFKTRQSHLQPQVTIASDETSFHNRSTEESLVKDDPAVPDTSSPLTSTYSSVSPTPPLDSTTPTPTTTSEQNANSRRSSRTPKQTQLFSFEHFKSETPNHQSSTVAASAQKDAWQPSLTKISQTPKTAITPAKRITPKSSTSLSFESASKRPRRTSSQTTPNNSSLPAATMSPPSKRGAPVPLALTQEEKDELLARELQGMQFGLREGRSRK